MLRRNFIQEYRWVDLVCRLWLADIYLKDNNDNNELYKTSYVPNTDRRPFNPHANPRMEVEVLFHIEESEVLGASTVAQW